MGYVVDGIRQVIESGGKFQTSALMAMGKWGGINGCNFLPFTIAVSGGSINERSTGVLSLVRAFPALGGQSFFLLANGPWFTLSFGQVSLAANLAGSYVLLVPSNSLSLSKFPDANRHARPPSARASPLCAAS